MTCTFFGHRNYPTEIELLLRDTVLDLIETKNVKNFYIGNHGAFDSAVYNLLKELSKTYHIKYSVVLAYVPGKKSYPGENFLTDTILPEGIESVPPKFAIVWRNKWMINQSDYVVTYVPNSVCGAAQFKEFAERKSKIVINLTI